MADGAAIVTFSVFIMGAICYIIALSTPYWSETKKISVGLFRRCDNYAGGWHCSHYRLALLNAKEKAVVSMMMIGLFTHTTSIIIYAIALCEGSVGVSRTGYGSILSGVLTLIAVCVYSSIELFAPHLSWSFVLACISAGLELISGFMLIGLVVARSRDLTITRHPEPRQDQYRPTSDHDVELQEKDVKLQNEQLY